MPSVPSPSLYVDVMCAHSYVAYPQLRAALSDLRAAGQPITLHIQPLLIMPDTPLDTAEPLHDVHRRHFGARTDAMEREMTQRAAAAGLTIDFERAQLTSTVPAMAAILQTQDRDPLQSEDLLAALFRAYFADGAIISDLDWLASFCKAHGVEDLDLTEEQFDRVRAANQAARRHGINGAPTVQLPGGDLTVGGRQRQDYVALLTAS